MPFSWVHEMPLAPGGTSSKIGCPPPPACPRAAAAPSRATKPRRVNVMQPVSTVYNPPMNRRTILAASAASLAGLRERAAALYRETRPNIKWCVSSFLWTSTQWPDAGTLPYTDMLDVIRDTGFDGFRLTGWPAVLNRIGMDLSQLEKELSKRGLRIATLSFNGPADDPAKHAEIERSAREACQFLKRFGATELVT